MQNPAKVLEHQVAYWGKTMKHYVEAQQALLKDGSAPADSGPKDKRFSNPLWDSNPAFNYLKQQYLPVSYTHLDVYKRQMQGIYPHWNNPMPSVTPSSRSCAAR